jgi:nitric oxide reductase subunit B
MWYARSAEFMQTPLMDKLRWLRVIGDTIFALGAVTLGLFVLGLKTGWSLEGVEIELETGAALPRKGGQPT